MFKNLTLARVSGIPSLADAEASAAAVQFSPCGPTQSRAMGFVPPREANGALIEAHAGHWILAVQIETKAVPPAALKKRVEEKARAYEQETGRKPGKKALREMKDQATLELLPQAFPKSKRVLVWVDTHRGILAADTASARVFDDVTMVLVSSIQGLALRPVMTNANPAGAMGAWLATGEPPHGFTIDQDCELKSMSEDKAVVRYARHPLDTDEVRQHILQGKAPTRVAITWGGRVSFQLTANLELRRLELLDQTLIAATHEEKADAFDADVAIFIGEARQLVADLIDALGGEFVAQQEGGAE